MIRLVKGRSKAESINTRESLEALTVADLRTRAKRARAIGTLALDDYAGRCDIEIERRHSGAFDWQGLPQSVQREVIEALALVAAIRPNAIGRTRQLLAGGVRDAIIKTVSGSQPSGTFTAFVAAGKQAYTFEAIVTRLPTHFPPEVVAAALDRLKAA